MDNNKIIEKPFIKIMLYILPHAWYGVDTTKMESNEYHLARENHRYSSTCLS